jgi:hypothetical protein
MLAMVLLPNVMLAQTTEPKATSPSHIFSLSPAELFYKTQLGYERRAGARNSFGVLGSYYYGNVGVNEGWQITGFYRRFLSQQFPTGFYVQAQASVLNCVQEIHLADTKTRQPYNFDYRATSGGAGFGFGYRTPLLRQLAQGRLLVNALLGVRFQHRPQPTYDANIYQPQTGFLGETDENDWYMGPNPSSLPHGLLSLDYTF